MDGQRDGRTTRATMRPFGSIKRTIRSSCGISEVLLDVGTSLNFGLMIMDQFLARLEDPICLAFLGARGFIFVEKLLIWEKSFKLNA